MLNTHEELVAFVLSQSADQPVSKRIRLYRALAVICGDAAEELHLLSMAAALEKAEALCREFKFSFVQSTSDK